MRTLAGSMGWGLGGGERDGHNTEGLRRRWLNTQIWELQRGVWTRPRVACEGVLFRKYLAGAAGRNALTARR